MAALNNEQMLLALQQSLAKKRVLIVDRHSPARDSLRLMLSALGITAVHGAGNSAEVIRQVKTHRFDIILSDFILDDGRDGQQLLEELRHAHLISLSTVYMIITSERSQDNVVALAELAPDDYLIKPFTADQLQARLIRTLFRKHILHRIYYQIERGALQEAIAACERVIQQQPAFIFDALRFKGEILHSLGKIPEAEAVYRQVLEARIVPWAKMGLAHVLRERGELEDAAQLVEQVIAESPKFLSAYDFLAAIHEARGKLADAQQALQRAANASPNNTLRQRMVGDIAVRNNDLETAEKAYGRVLDRSRGSSLRTVDDFANLSRTLAERGDVGNSRKITGELRREWRGDKQADLAALVNESLCLHQEGNAGKAAEIAGQALVLQQAVADEAAEKGKHLSQRLSIDLAHACLAAGMDETAEKLLRQVAAENHEDPRLIEQISSVFAKTGRTDAGKALLDRVGKEIIELNNQGVRAAQSGDLEAAVKLLIQAAEQVPNLQFLVNAAKAIFTYLDKTGWNHELAERGAAYIKRAQVKDRKNPKVASARELYVTVAQKYGVLVIN